MHAKTLTAAVAAALLTLAPAVHASEADLAKRIEQLAAELEQLKAELKATRAAQAAPATGPVATPAAAPATATAAPVAAAVPAPAAANNADVAAAPATVLTGYGEINYNRPTRNASAAQTDVRRAVIGIQHRFDERTKLVSEFEWEHAIASAEDAGESAIEQLYVERQFANGVRGKAGLFLIPAGLLNTAHEPTAYYGVERNFVETAIIPTTWREAGIGLSGELANGLAWDAGLTTGFDLTKWDATSSEGLESPLGAIHQEGQLAKSRHLAVHGALNWRGVPGLLLGGSVFSGQAGHKAPDFAAPDARVTLWDLHARYTPGPWDLSALYARGAIAGIDALNQTFAGNPTPVPSRFAGWYVQAAVKAYSSGDVALSPFVRYERFNTAQRITPMPPGLEFDPAGTEGVSTVGANLYLGEGVVLKADYQKFRLDKTRDRLNLGVGFAY